MGATWSYKVAGVLTVALMLVAGCSSAKPATPPTAPAPAAPAPAPSKPQVAGMAIQDEPASLDPVETIQLTAYQVLNFIMEPLVYIGPDKQPKGWVAESWTVEDAGKTIIFKIRKDRKFHDGTALDAKAVAFTFNRHLDDNKKSANRTGLGPLTKVEAVDDYTVKFTYSAPYAPVWTSLSSPFYGIVSPAAADKLGKDFSRNIVASGPFKLEKWIPATGFDLVRFAGYKSPRVDVDNKGEAKLDRLEIRIVPEEGTRVAALETGKIHFGDAPREGLDRFKSDPKYKVVVNEKNNSFSMIEVNPFKAPTDDINVRRAIAYAVNIEQIATAAYAGLATPNYTAVPLGNTGYDKSIGDKYGYKYDVAKAKALLEQSGYKMGSKGVYEKDGKPLTIVLWTYTLPNGMKGGQVIQENLKAAGFDVKFETFEVASVIGKLKERQHNINFMWWSGWDPVFMSLVWKTPGWQKVYSNPKLDEILVRAESELDPVKRQQHVVEAQKFILEDAGVIPICTDWSVLLTRADLVGLKLDSQNFILLNDAEIK